MPTWLFGSLHGCRREWLRGDVAAGDISLLISAGAGVMLVGFAEGLGASAAGLREAIIRAHGTLLTDTWISLDDLELIGALTGEESPDHG